MAHARNVSLTPGGVHLILSNILQPGTHQPPVLQVLRCQSMPNQQWQVILSDGEHYMYALLEDRVMQALRSAGDTLNAVVEVRQWFPPLEMHGRLAVSIQDMAILGHTTCTIGKPQMWLGQSANVQSLPHPSPEPLTTDVARNPYSVPVRAGQVAGARVGTCELQQQGNRWKRPETPVLKADDVPLVAISQLEPMLPHFRIRARVLGRSSVRRYRNIRGDGQCASVELVDRERGAIRATLFGKAVDQFFGLLIPQKIVEIVGSSVKTGNPRFTPHPLEIAIGDRDSVKGMEDDGSIPGVEYNFTSISRLPELPTEAIVDIAGVVMETQALVSFATKSGETRSRRNMVLADGSGTSCKLTLWGAHADSLEARPGMVLFLRSVRVSDFGGGRSVESTDLGFIEADSDDQRAFSLARWYQERSLTTKLKSLSGSGGPEAKRKFLTECVAEDLQLPSPGENARFATHSHGVSPLTVTYVGDRQPFYMACTVEVPSVSGQGPPRQCFKKAARVGGSWQCSGGHMCEAVARYLLRCRVSDPTMSGFWVNAFDQEAEALFGVPATEFARWWELQDAGDIAAVEEVRRLTRESLFRRWDVRLRSKREAWEGQERVKVTLASCSEIDHVAQGRQMLSAIWQSLGVDAGVGGA